MRRRRELTNNDPITIHSQCGMPFPRCASRRREAPAVLACVHARDCVTWQACDQHTQTPGLIATCRAAHFRSNRTCVFRGAQTELQWRVNRAGARIAEMEECGRAAAAELDSAQTRLAAAISEEQAVRAELNRCHEELMTARAGTAAAAEERVRSFVLVSAPV